MWKNEKGFTTKIGLKNLEAELLKFRCNGLIFPSLGMFWRVPGAFLVCCRICAAYILGLLITCKKNYQQVGTFKL